MTVEELLGSPVGRRMVEAVHAASLRVVGTGKERKGVLDIKEGIAAALRVALDDTCQTCGGCGLAADPELVADPDVPRGRDWMPCPDCKDGRVTPALVDPRASGFTPEQQARIELRAEERAVKGGAS